MEENQNNVNQQPIVWQNQQTQQVQENNQEVSVSMQIQQLLVQQQQYQQQYNQLVDYVKKTPNLPIEQVNQIKAQLDQLNALFVKWKQRLQELWYNQVQVKKPSEVKSGSKINLSFKRLAIWCGIVIILILIWFFITLFSLRNNPDSLQWIWVWAAEAKMMLQVFCWLLFWSIILLMIWVVVSNIYRIITVKNQWKSKYIWGLIWWLIWTGVVWAWMWIVLWLIWGIVVTKWPTTTYPIQPYLIGMSESQWWWRVSKEYDYKNPAYPLIAPSEFGFQVIWNNAMREIYNKIWVNVKLQSLTLLCWNKQWQTLEILNEDTLNQVENWQDVRFSWTCLYGEKWEYKYTLQIKYKNTLTKEENLVTNISTQELDFDSEIKISLTTTNSSSSNNRVSRIYPTNWEFSLWKAPAKITIDTTQVFRDFNLGSYNVVWYLDDDKIADRENQTTFDYFYKIPQVYYPSVKFPDLSNFLYTFPVRVEQSEYPICEINIEKFPWTTKYQITTDFIDSSSAATISSYNYTIWDKSNNKKLESLKDYPQEFAYTFPEKWSYVVILDYETIDWKQWQCESEVIQLEKERFNIQYAILDKDEDTWKFKELCNSWWTWYEKCTSIKLDSMPKTYQLQIKSITPSSNTTKKVVYLDGKPLLNENDTYEFTISNEWTFSLKIVTSDVDKEMDEEEINIKINAKKPDIVWNITITSNDSRQPVSEWFEPLTVILDASKTEINVPWDEIIYFTWDFWDGEKKQNQQNWVVSHTYNFDYVNENWVFQPKVEIKTKWWLTDTIYWPKLNIKKWLISIDLSSTSHPAGQAPVWKDVTFFAEFDWLPEEMVWDFWDGSPVTTCPWRTCSEVVHTYKDKWNFSIKLNLKFDTAQEVGWTMKFKVY